MKNWKRLFAPIILNRGYEYYMDDLVCKSNSTEYYKELKSQYSNEEQ